MMQKLVAQYGDASSKEKADAKRAAGGDGPALKPKMIDDTDVLRLG